MRIDASLARALLAEQFPEWAGLEVRPIEPGGWDNRSFRIGTELVARLPSERAYAAQVDKEHRWLPELAPRLPIAIPALVAKGQPGCGYEWPWSIREWIEGKALTSRSIETAIALGRFLAALQGIDTRGAPAAGEDNFHRGGSLDTYDAEVRRALVILEGRIDERKAMALWNEAIATRWSRAPAWVHGDIAPGNLLEDEGGLAAVIDFGNLAAGDPACDLAIAWTWLDGESRHAFRSTLDLDDATWLRGRAWALWKALIVASGLAPTNAREYAAPLEVIERCLENG